MVDIPVEIHEDIQWFLEHFPDDYPFRIFRPNRITAYVKMWLRIAGLSEDLCLHSIRHTSLSLAANRPNANLRAIQQLSGHTTLSMVERYINGKSKGKVSFGKNYNAYSVT
jgi:integrase